MVTENRRPILFVRAVSAAAPAVRRSSTRGLVAFVGAATLAEYVFDWDAGIDYWFFLDASGALGPWLSRMAPETALGLLLLGAARWAHPSDALVPLRRRASDWSGRCTLSTTQRHPRWREREGLTADHFLGKSAREIVGPEVAAVHEEANARALAVMPSTTVSSVARVERNVRVSATWPRNAAVFASGMRFAFLD